MTELRTHLPRRAFPARAGAAFLLGVLLFSGTRAAADGTNAVAATIDAGQTRAPISKYMYGQFIEHLANIINNRLWAEMLEDRKFYNPIGTQIPPAEPTAGARELPRRWAPIGPADAVLLDTNHPYAGEHSPLIKLDESGPRGIQQGGLTLRQSKSYLGRVILSVDPGVIIALSLVWGTNAADRQTVTLSKLHAGYTRFPMSFQARADTEDGRLEISGTGVGAFRVGAVSLMPADNLQGFRADVIGELKTLRSGVYRFPGGNFVSGHEWRDAIGERDTRPPRWDAAWNAIQPNDVGIDEFMDLCGLLGVEPYITVNAGFGDAYSAAQLVEYANGAPSTPMGKLRAANGHPQAYGIKWWGVGNEMYGDWQLGNMSLQQFELKHNNFARVMRRADPNIKLIASGAMPDEMTVTRQARRITGQTVAEYGSGADWTGGLLARCRDNLDLVSEHYYCYNNQRFDLERGEMVAVDEPLIDWARRPANRVRAKFEHYQEYLQRIPGFKEKPAPIIIDEWAYARAPLNAFKPALSYAWAFHEMFRHTEVFQMAAFTFATSMLSANRTEAVLNPTGLVFKLYRDHFGTIPVAVAGDSPPPPPKYPVGGDQPRVNAGSDTYPLDVAAALAGDKKSLTVAVVNPTESAQVLKLAFKGADLSGAGRLWRMAPASVNATNAVGQKPQVEVEEIPIGMTPGSVTIPPGSVNLYELTLRP